MTIFFPDVSQYTPVSLAGAPVALARASIGLVKDTHYDQFVADAGTHGVPLAAYHFLNAGSLGASPEAQADFAYSVIGRRATMLDHEPNRNACASLAEAIRFINRYRDLGGMLHLSYLPKWAWSDWMGSPDLTVLRDMGVSIVASNYTTYSDTGPGWAAYGGVTPVQWQYSSTHVFNGVGCDWNAYLGDLTSYLALVNGDNDVSIGDIVPQTGGKSLGMCVSDIFHTISDGYSGYVPAARMPIPAYLDLLNGKIDALSKVLAAVVSAEDVDLQQVLAALAALPVAASVVALSDAQVAAVGTAVAAAVVGGHDALNAADLAGVQAAAEAAVRAVLGGLG